MMNVALDDTISGGQVLKLVKNDLEFQVYHTRKYEEINKIVCSSNLNVRLIDTNAGWMVSDSGRFLWWPWSSFV
jgi:hypothetical protein